LGHIKQYPDIIMLLGRIFTSGLLHGLKNVID